MKRALLFFAIFLLTQLMVVSLFTGVVKLFGLSVSAGGMAVVSTMLFSVVVIVLFSWLRWTPVSAFRPNRRSWGALLWSAVAACGTLLLSLALQDLLPELPNFVEAELGLLTESPWGYLSVALCAPVAEEFVFRGAVLRSLLSWARHPWGAIALSALFFSVAHLNPAQMVHAFLVGLLLGWLYWRTGSVLPGIVFHCVNNSLAWLLERAFPGADHLSDLFSGHSVQMAVALILSLLVLLYALRRLKTEY